ncbi:type II toxin-antitoxin system death-on-curing family toxin [Arcanobacterium hippocoleae]
MLLDAAINAPFQTFGGVDLYPTLIEKAACLGYSLSANHPFVDGNKRIGAHAMLVFLSVNGVELSYRDEELVKLYLDIASGKESQQSLASWIEAHMIDKNFLQ